MPSVKQNLGAYASVDDFQDAYQGCYDDLEDYARQYVDDTGMLHDMPDNLKYYFDYAAFARDAEMGGDIWTERGDDGLHVFYNH